MTTMQYCKVDVQLAGKLTDIVKGKRVSVPEIVILRHIHGNDSVSNIRVLPPEAIDLDADDYVPYDDAAERDRLFTTYERVAPENERGFINQLFPQMQALPRTLRHIGVYAVAEAENKREQAARLLAEADSLEASETGEDEFDTSTTEEQVRKERADRRRAARAGAGAEAN